MWYRGRKWNLQSLSKMRSQIASSKSKAWTQVSLFPRLCTLCLAYCAQLYPWNQTLAIMLCLLILRPNPPGSEIGHLLSCPFPLFFALTLQLFKDTDQSFMLQFGQCPVLYALLLCFSLSPSQVFCTIVSEPSKARRWWSKTCYLICF